MASPTLRTVQGHLVVVDDSEAFVLCPTSGMYFRLAPAEGGLRHQPVTPPIERALSIVNELVAGPPPMLTRRSVPPGHVLTYVGRLARVNPFLQLEASIAMTRRGTLLLCGGKGSGKSTIAGLFASLSGAEVVDRPIRINDDVELEPDSIWLLDVARRRGEGLVLVRLSFVAKVQAIVDNISGPATPPTRRRAMRLATRLAAGPSYEVTLPKDVELLSSALGEFLGP